MGGSHILSKKRVTIGEENYFTWRVT